MYTWEFFHFMPSVPKWCRDLPFFDFSLAFFKKLNADAPFFGGGGQSSHDVIRPGVSSVFNFGTSNGAMCAVYL